MLFNKKFLMGICNVVGLLLLFMVALNIVMYVWAMYGTAPIPLFEVKNGVVSYYLLLNKLMNIVLFYLATGTMAWIIKSSKLPEVVVVENL